MSESGDIDDYGDSISDYKTTLSDLPQTMLFGSKSLLGPPTPTLFGDEGSLIWEYLSKARLWGTFAALQGLTHRSALPLPPATNPVTLPRSLALL